MWGSEVHCFSSSYFVYRCTLKVQTGLISIQPNKSVSPSQGPADQLKKWKYLGSSSRLSRSRWRVVSYPTRWSLLFIVQLCTRWRGDCRRSPSSSGWDSSSPPHCSAFPGSSSPTSSFSRDSGSLACSIWPGSTTTSPRATGRSVKNRIVESHLLLLRGGWSGWANKWVRGWPLWNHFKDFFPIKMVKTSDLDPQRYTMDKRKKWSIINCKDCHCTEDYIFHRKYLLCSQVMIISRNYLLCSHPHGVLSAGAFCCFATEGTNFSEASPIFRLE